ncbi:RidA family protein [bacterium RCC_150]
MTTHASTQAIHTISADGAPPAAGPYVHAKEFGGVLYISGQLPVDPNTLRIEHEDAAGQTRQAIANITSILESAGCSLENLLKTSIFLTNISDFAEVNSTYSELVGIKPPARSCVEVGALPHPDARVEIEATAALPTKKPSMETAL